MNDQVGLVKLTPGFPTYTAVCHFIRILDGVSYSLFHSMVGQLYDQRGTPQENEDWSDPDNWIPERLSNSEKNLASQLWRNSEHQVNPRFTWGCWGVASNHQLLNREDQDILRLTPRGRDFLAKKPEIITEIDNKEGVLIILQIVAEHSPAKRRELLSEFTTYCHTFTTARSESVIKNTLYKRLMNLIERGFINRTGQTYVVTDAGINYLDTNSRQITGRVIADKQSDLLRLTREMSKEARQKLEDYLLTMNPYKFEELIKALLQNMGYDNVETTSPTNDKGVDVVADIELGISQVSEVVQVKRYKGNINRPVLDGLRGSLHRFRAVRGTIITTGGFSPGTKQAAFEVGAAPITLIDGDTLLDLLIEHEIGITRKQVDYIEFDSEGLKQFEPDNSTNADEN